MTARAASLLERDKVGTVERERNVNVLVCIIVGALDLFRVAGNDFH